MRLIIFLNIVFGVEVKKSRSRHEISVKSLRVADENQLIKLDSFISLKSYNIFENLYLVKTFYNFLVILPGFKYTCQNSVLSCHTVIK